MQRAFPIFVAAVFVLAVAAAILPLPRLGGQAGETLQTRLGLDLVGGLRGEYQVVATDAQPVTPDILEQTRTIIENRVNAYGVAEPIVVTQGQDRVSVELPGEDDEEELRRLIGATGILEFIPVPPEFDQQVADGLRLPESMADIELLFTGIEIASAQPGTDPNGLLAVDIQLKETGARIFDEHAEEFFVQRFAIVLDGIVQSAPSINARNFNGQAQISGSFTPDQM